MQLWPKLAAWFGLEVGPPLKVRCRSCSCMRCRGGSLCRMAAPNGKPASMTQVPLATMMPYHKDTWQRAVEKYHLNAKDYPYEKVRWGILAVQTVTSLMPLVCCSVHARLRNKRWGVCLPTAGAV